jgi:hypothetical protein
VFKKIKLVDNVQNNNHVFPKTPLSEAFRLGLIVSVFINGIYKVGKVINTVWSMVTVMLENVCYICVTVIIFLATFF